MENLKSSTLISYKFDDYSTAISSFSDGVSSSIVTFISKIFDVQIICVWTTFKIQKVFLFFIRVS